MKRKFTEAVIGNIDDRFIIEAAEEISGREHRPERITNMHSKKRHYAKYLIAIAAAVCLILAMGVAAYAMGLFSLGRRDK